ncbi:MAG: Crp/Fnr family transcriptional regulator [Clostridiales bacterium]|nr:Crp/Fnr family transcriptional regulator [Clostridiales bacterium]
MKSENSMMGPLLFSGIDEDTKASLESLGRIKNWSRGELIVSEGDVCKGLYIILKGFAAVQKYTPAGDYSTICLLHDGDCFGEEIVCSKEKKYISALEAVSDVKILFLPTAPFVSSMESSPKLRENFHLVISRRFASLERMITILSQKTVRQKISYYLIFLSDEQKSERVELPVSKEVIAKLLAIPRQSFSRELSQMVTEEKISVSGRVIEIKDMPSMKKEIGEA